jgi:hypothetical protein
MFRLRLYYFIKPLLPWGLRIVVRRYFARQKLKKVSHIWPINEPAAKKPDNWPGWPDGKQFAFVLTHDVETQKGLDNVRRLAELEMELGFRSSFNFIPEGEYETPDDLIVWLKGNGFEVGVHDHRHDGKLYTSHKAFRKAAERINQYIDKWGATGFRSGFMLRNLDWLHDLNIQYDASTFDTDPFEPQNDGLGTIFPAFIEKQPSQSSSQERQSRPRDAAEEESAESELSAFTPRPSGSSSRTGYVELPYTLPQDSTLFLLLQEKSNQIWKDKLDWIAENGGMALLNLHPDYITFEKNPRTDRKFSYKHYREFLSYLKKEYNNDHWHVLPKKLAAFSKPILSINSSNATGSQKIEDYPVEKIWIDLENTPHIPFFNPIVKELERRGIDISLTARDAYQTCAMADLYNFSYDKIGKHYGKNKLLKSIGLIIRSLQLIPFALREKPTLALNHGSRTQTFISKILRIPTITIMDYEHSSGYFLQPEWEILPEVIGANNFHKSKTTKVLTFSGIKEDVYVPDFTPDTALREELDLKNGSVVITVRPPATEAHYHNPESETLFLKFMEQARQNSQTKIILLPRNKRQETHLRTSYPDWFKLSKTIIPKGVVDGLNLLWHSDLVVSGGGTMNREAAALGVPVFSTFRGEIGAVDLHLQKEGRLVLIESEKDIDEKIEIVSRKKDFNQNSNPRRALSDIVGNIESILAQYRSN